MYWLRASKLRSGKTREDPRDRLRDRLLADVDVARRVVLEDRVVGVHGDDRLDVVVVPGRVVAVDELLELGAVHGASLRQEVEDPKRPPEGRDDVGALSALA